MLNKFTWIFLFAGTLVFMYLMVSTGKTLKTITTPDGILDLEFANSAESVSTILNAWSIKGKNGSVIDDAKRNTYLDFIFIVFYASFLYSSCRIIGIRNPCAIISNQSGLIANAALVAGLFDILENIGMLQSLTGKVSDSLSLYTASCAYTKFMLLLMVILFLFFGLVAAVRHKLRAKRNYSPN